MSATIQRSLRALAFAALLVSTLGGCTSWIAHRIVDAPNGGEPRNTMVPMLRPVVDAMYVHRARVPVGPPAAELALAIVPAAEYAVAIRTGGNESKRCVAFEIAVPVFPLSGQNMEQAYLRGLPDAVREIPQRQPVATVMLVPGYGVSKELLLGWSWILGEAGYRVVLLDLRGQGQSTGAHTTYGIRESRDLVQVIDYLERQDLLRGPLVVAGLSLGAATALAAASDDPRIAGVLAMEPYARATDVIPTVAKLWHPWLARLISETQWQRAIAAAGSLAGVDLARAAPIKMIDSITVPLLMVFGGEDRIAGNPEAFRRAAPDAELVVVEGANHMTLLTYRETMEVSLRWLATHFGGDVPELPLIETEDGSDAEDHPMSEEAAAASSRNFTFSLNACMTFS